MRRVILGGAAASLLAVALGLIGCGSNSDKRRADRIAEEQIENEPIAVNISHDKEAEQAPRDPAAPEATCQADEDCTAIPVPTDNCIPCLREGGQRPVNIQTARAIMAPLKDKCLPVLKELQSSKQQPQRSTDPSCTSNGAKCQKGTCVLATLTKEELKRRMPQRPQADQDQPATSEGYTTEGEPPQGFGNDQGGSPYGGYNNGQGGDYRSQYTSGYRDFGANTGYPGLGRSPQGFNNAQGLGYGQPGYTNDLRTNAGYPGLGSSPQGFNNAQGLGYGQPGYTNDLRTNAGYPGLGRSLHGFNNRQGLGYGQSPYANGYGDLRTNAGYPGLTGHGQPSYPGHLSGTNFHAQPQFNGLRDLSGAQNHHFQPSGSYSHSGLSGSTDLSRFGYPQGFNHGRGYPGRSF